MKNGTWHSVLFDLDGTLTDSGPGIMRCAARALEELGLDVPGEDELRTFVGPPLKTTFGQFGVPEDRIEEAIRIYRSYYHVTGKWENYPYPGISQLLHDLRSAGLKLYVATSKPEALSREILEKFDLAPYFNEICGATMDHSRENKDDVLRYLLRKTGSEASSGDHDPAAAGTAGMVMVGDTVYDVLGAAKVGLACVGVAWGYGKTEEMREAGALAVVDSMEELKNLLLAGIGG